MISRQIRNAVFSDEDDFMEDVALDIISTREYHHRHQNDSGCACMDMIFRCIYECDFKKILPTFLVSNAFSCSVTVMTACRFVRRDEIQSDNKNNIMNVQFGLWSYADDQGECQSYDFTSPMSIASLDDRLFRAARGLAFIAAILGFFAMAGMWMSALQDHHNHRNTTILKQRLLRRRARWKSCVASGLILCSIVQGLTLLLFHSNACHDTTTMMMISTDESGTNTVEPSSTGTLLSHGKCQWGDGGWWVLAALLQYMATLMLVLELWPCHNLCCSNKKHEHSTLAGDESEEDQHSYPAEIADDDDLWEDFWKGLGSEEVELINLSRTPYSDTVVTEPSTPVAMTTTTFPVSENTNRPLLSQQPQPSSSLRDLIQSFDSELLASFEPMNPNDHQYNTTTTTTTKKTHTMTLSIVEIAPPPPRVHNESSLASLERLQHQSRIQPIPSFVVSSVQGGGNVQKPTAVAAARVTPTENDVALRSRVDRERPLREQQQQHERQRLRIPHRNGQVNSYEKGASMVSSKKDPSQNRLNSLLDAFDDDTL